MSLRHFVRYLHTIVRRYAITFVLFGVKHVNIRSKWRRTA